jgi:hypothetical protein
MLDETSEIEEAAHVRIAESALKDRSVRITPEFILTNADNPGHFRFPRGRDHSASPIASLQQAPKGA